METISASHITLMDLASLTQGMASINATYLTISVTIVLALGAAFYFFNLKPLEEKIAKQEEALSLEKKANADKLEHLTAGVLETQKNVVAQIKELRDELEKTISEKVTSAEKRVESIENLARKEIDAMKDNANCIELTIYGN